MNQNRKDITIDPVRLFSDLRAMIGKDYTYRNQPHRIIEVMEAGAGFSIMTDKGNLNIKISNAAHFISECLAVETLPGQSNQFLPTKALQIISKEDALLNELTDGLHQQFRKLQQTPSKAIIDQTESMVETSKAITDIVKLKLIAYKLSQNK